MSIFNLKPTVCTFLQEAYTFGILENPEIPSILLNSHIQLALPIGMERNPQAHFDFHPALSMKGYAATGALKMCSYVTEWQRNLSENKLPQMALKAVESAGYVLLYVDYFYVKGAARYAKHHFRHDLLLFEYDAHRREFKGAFYTADRTFGLGTIPFQNLFEACRSPYARSHECYGYCRGDLFAVFKAGSGRRRMDKLDLKDIRTQLNCYLNSADLANHPLKNELINQLCQLYRATNKEVIYGISIYDHIWKFFEQILAKGYLWRNIWQIQRATRLLWEHKKLMKVRILRIMEEGFSLDPEFLAKWDEVVQIAYLIHLRVMAADERNDPSLLCSLPKELTLLKLMEEERLNEIVKRIG